MLRTNIDKIDTTKTEKKVTMDEDRLGRKTLTLRLDKNKNESCLYNFLLIITVDWGVIIKLEKDYIV